MWRAKLGALCRMLNLNSDNYQVFLKEWFGRHWAYVLGPVIGSIKLLEFYAEEEARKSLRATWVVAVNERERRRNRWRRATRGATKRWMPGCDSAQAVEPVRVWTSWIEHTAKDD
jgi:hypothetical protein